MINVALVGTGSIAGTHLEAFARFKDRCRITALVDRSGEKAEKLKERFGLDCAIYSDYEDVLKLDSVDLVSLCTPPSTHANLASAFLLAGKHVLVEKPMAPSLSECDQMLEAAAKGDALLSVVGQNRFYDPIRRVKQVLDAGLAGRIVHAEANSYWWRGRSYYDVEWRGTWESEGGGCVMNHAVHHLDLLLWIRGMPSEVQAVTVNTSHENSQVEDLSIAILKYPDGGLAQVTSSVVHHGEEQRLVFQGERAKVGMPWQLYASTEGDGGFPQRNPNLEAEIQQVAEELAPLQYTGHAGQMDDVLRAIESGSRQVMIDGIEGRKTIELIMAIYESSATGKPVALPLSKDSIFYAQERILREAPRFHSKA
ncbi:MAG: Gfo/Idh/MocA family oxidoreductase [Paenibacillus sp.]|uniref:Gfo/Idh/MocA family protein n=1 Tax=Paenibacillus sp. TaxID=58172 RepID=UPI002914C8FC|nr:Gfo/Idh/MocA family oxidoreductase [Paenibacillus sp.]MDU4695475.1 Gfo/Idh/MocA family oxidoreductase [Paenibacillus sp.]